MSTHQTIRSIFVWLSALSLVQGFNLQSPNNNHLVVPKASTNSPPPFATTQAKQRTSPIWSTPTSSASEETTVVAESEVKKEDEASNSTALQDDAAVVAVAEREEPLSSISNVFQRVKSYFGGNKENDGLTFRQRMAKMGISVMLSYGFVSNVNYSVTLSISWFLFAKQTGMSPLYPGQWKRFLALSAGFYIFNNIIRPLRVAASVALAPKFEALVLRIRNRFNVSKGVAIALTVFAVNLVGTTAMSASMIAAASALAGVPAFPPKVL